MQRAVSISTGVLMVVLAFLWLVDYIEGSLVINVYLPLWLVAVFPVTWGRCRFGALLLSAASLGLLAEYALHLNRSHQPSMQGALLNIAIVLVGALTGILLELRRA